MPCEALSRGHFRICTMGTDWRVEYVKAAALEEDKEGSTPTPASQQNTKAPVDKVLAFLDLLLAEEGGEWWAQLQHRAKPAAKQKSDHQEVTYLSGEDKKQLKALKMRFAAVGDELVIKLPELNASVSSKETPRAAKVRVLQLQLVCRVLCYGALTKTKKEEKKALKKEIRGLLDRVALLLDAANPPSLADEDADERSPFQEFLQHELAPRLQMLQPELVQYLLRVYELEEVENPKDDVDKDSLAALLPTPPQPPAEVRKSAVTSEGSILSALSQERPSKRPRPATSGLFKEVQLPQQMQQMQSRPRKSRRVSKPHTSSASKSNHAGKTRRGQDSLLRVAAGAKLSNQARALEFAGTAKTGLVSSIRKTGETDLLRRAAMKSSVKSPTAPLLHRATSDQSNPAGRQYATSSSPGQVAGTVATRKSRSPPWRQAMTTSSVVMRTPDRPKRMAARATRRVLVEASPPLRRPGAAPRLLQPKSLRPGVNPPSLFGNDSKFK